MIDASQGFMKDGPKNRVRAQDIHKIVDVFNRRLEISKYSRMVSFDEIERNEFNLNLPRYIDRQQAEDIRTSMDTRRAASPPPCPVTLKTATEAVCPKLKRAVQEKPPRLPRRIAVDKPAIKSTIYENTRSSPP